MELCGRASDGVGGARAPPGAADCSHSQTARWHTSDPPRRGCLLQQGHQSFQLLDRHPDRCLSPADPTLRKNGTPTAGLSRQKHHRRELPTNAHWPVGMRHIGQGDHAPIRTRFHCRASTAGAIHAHPDWSLVLGQQRLRPDLAPCWLIDPSIFQGFIDTGPLATKASRERQLGQPVGLRLTTQRIHQLQERIGTAFKTMAYLMTNLVPHVKVQSVNVLCLSDVFAKHFPSSGSFWQSEAASCV